MKQTNPSDNQTLVMKFGGTSVGNSQAMLQVAQIVLDAKKEWRHVIVVTSAMAGVTNFLLETVDLAITGDREKVRAAVQEL